MGDRGVLDKVSRRLAAAFLVAGGLLLHGPLLAQPVPPDAAYRTFETEHFRVTYPEGLRPVAERAAERAERAHRILRERFLPPPPGRIDMLVSDHADLSNGFARVTPGNRIEIWARPPVEGRGLAHFDDWLELVVTHEVAHIFHLDRTGPIGRVLRPVFGRVPRRWPYFSGFTLPILGIEGVAVMLESEHTAGGRLHGSFHESIVRAHALDGGVEGVGSALGEGPVWPGGDRPYVYGSLLFGWLADRFGEEAVAEFLEAAANQWIPFRMNAAARSAFGHSFDALWDEWREEVEEEARELRSAIGDRAGPPAPEFLTRGARQAFHAAPVPGGGGVAYLRADGRSETRLVLREGEGADAVERTLSRWNGISPPTWTPAGELVAPQLEYLDRYQLRRDLYRVGEDGGVERLTRGLRVVHADAHPGDGRFVAVVEGEGTNRLLLLSAEGEPLGVLREAEPGVLWSYPRWSPEGDRIAVARWRAGGWSSIQILDSSGSELGTLVEDGALNTAPAWAPDGEWLLWSSDRSGSANLYAARVGSGSGQHETRQVTDLATAGSYPGVDSAGRWIYLSVLGGEGWDLARVPFDPSRWIAPLAADPRFAEGHGRLAEGNDLRLPAQGGEERAYSALPTVRPHYWLPLHLESQSVRVSPDAPTVRVLPLALGVETSGSDLVGRHGYSASLLIPVQDGSRLDWSASYAWAGLGNPVLRLETAQVNRAGTAQVARPEDAPPDTLYPHFIDRSVGGAVELRRQRVRSVGTLSLGMRSVGQETRLLDSSLAESTRYRAIRPHRSLVEGRLSAAYSTARSFAFSVSPEEGASVSLFLRDRRDRSVPDTLVDVPGLDGAFREAVVSARLYRGLGGWGFANHVLGVRVVGATAAGPGAGGRHFLIGGGGGGGTGAGGFTHDAASGLFPVRGFPLGHGGGMRAWAATGEWRFPLALLHRGFGAWPLYLDRLAGSFFVDMAWANPVRGEGAATVSLGSVGAELALVHATFFETPSQLRAGVAVPFQGEADPSVYLGYRWGF